MSFRQGIAPPALPRAAWLAAAAATACLCVLSFLFLDAPLARLMRGAPDDLHQAFKLVSALGDSVYWLVPTALAWIGCRWAMTRAAQEPRWDLYRWIGERALFLFVCVAASGLLVDVLKVTFGRARPKMLFAETPVFGFDPISFKAAMQSFPSGHANTIAALMTALWVLAPRFWPLYLPIGVTVALSRVVIGAHYLSDVAAGAFLGVFTTILIARKFQGRLDGGRRDVPRAVPVASAN